MIFDSADNVAAVRTRQAERVAKTWWEFWNCLQKDYLCRTRSPASVDEVLLA
jgi:hypothetical protein